MDGITIAPLTNYYLAQIGNWPTAHVGAMLLAASEDTSLAGFGNNTHIEGWVALRDNAPVAIATVSVNNLQNGYLDFVVKPSERRQGIGAYLVKYVLSQPAVRRLHMIETSVSLDNSAGQKILAREGFSAVGYAQDGLMRYEKH